MLQHSMTTHAFIECIIVHAVSFMLIVCKSVSQTVLLQEETEERDSNDTLTPYKSDLEYLNDHFKVLQAQNLY